MSRIGRHPIAIPAGVTVTVSDDNHVVVKGPKGQLEQTVNKNITMLAIRARYRPWKARFCFSSFGRVTCTSLPSTLTVMFLLTVCSS